MAVHEDYSRIQEVKASSDRSFGLVFTVVFAIAGAWPLVSGGMPRWWWLAAAVIVLAVALLRPALLAVPNRLWLRFGLLLHRIVSPIVLGIMFYAVLTPIGLLMRLLGKDSLRVRDKAAGSYWIRRDPPGPQPKSLDKQF